jgi:hypothetical protein
MRCAYKGDINTFPLKKGGGGHTKTCSTCTDDRATKRSGKENQKPPEAEQSSSRRAPRLAATHLQPSTISLQECLELVSNNRNNPFELDAFVTVSPDVWNASGNETQTVHARANRLRDLLAEASDYHWK